MSLALQRTTTASAATLPDRWFLVDARGEVLGRLAVNLARVLRGKHRAVYTPHALCADHLVVINAADIVVTGSKRRGKLYDRYSGYPGGRTVRTYDQVVARDATWPLREAVRGMLQHNSLGRQELQRLRVYRGGSHPHAAQQPLAITFGALGEVQVT
ncbi:MAG TPA: 50S ribosomal protein L13 [Verrucomicrobiae bacterium]|nr:50S ribosomal protein L13 [Verrucomicrobiae bacterium]